MAIDALAQAAKKKAFASPTYGAASNSAFWQPYQARPPQVWPNPDVGNPVNLPSLTNSINDWGTSSASSGSTGGTGGGAAGSVALSPYSDPEYLALISQIEATRQKAQANANLQTGQLDTSLAQRMAELRRQYQRARGVTASNARVRGTRNSSQYQNNITDLGVEENRNLSESEQSVAAQKAALAQMLQQQEDEFGITRSQAALSAAERLQMKADAAEQQRQNRAMLEEIQRQNREALQRVIDEMNNIRGVPNGTEPTSPVPGSTAAAGGANPNYLPQDVQDRLTQIAFLRAVSAANPQAAYLNSMRIAGELANMGYTYNPATNSVTRG